VCVCVCLCVFVCVCVCLCVYVCSHGTHRHWHMIKHTHAHACSWTQTIVKKIRAKCRYVPWACYHTYTRAPKIYPFTHRYMRARTHTHTLLLPPSYLLSAVLCNTETIISVYINTDSPPPLQSSPPLTHCFTPPRTHNQQMRWKLCTCTCIFIRSRRTSRTKLSNWKKSRKLGKYVNMYIHAYMHTCIHAYMHTCIHAYMHTCIQAYMHAYMHSYIHIYIHTW